MTTRQQVADTGVKGFLKWFRKEQPAIYAKIAPTLQQRFPQAFSAYMNGGWKFHALSDTAPTVDTADAANSGSTTADIINGIGSLINSASSAYLTYQQAQTQNNIVNAQLQAALMGRPAPLVSLGSNGVPQVSFAATAQGQTSLTTLALWGVGIFAGLKLLKVI